jgi:hypothetical protein
MLGIARVQFEDEDREIVELVTEQWRYPFHAVTTLG